jgi:hypothetical protein
MYNYYMSLKRGTKGKILLDYNIYCLSLVNIVPFNAALSKLQCYLDMSKTTHYFMGSNTVHMVYSILMPLTSLLIFS